MGPLLRQKAFQSSDKYMLNSLNPLSPSKNYNLGFLCDRVKVKASSQDSNICCVKCKAQSALFLGFIDTKIGTLEQFDKYCPDSFFYFRYLFCGYKGNFCVSHVTSSTDIEGAIGNKQIQARILMYIND